MLDSMPFDLPWLWIPVVAVVAVAAIVATVWVFNRDLTSGGPRSTTGGGGSMFGGLTEAFDPGAHRAELEKERMRHQAVATPAPGPRPDRVNQVETDRYGNPIRFVVRGAAERGDTPGKA